MVQDGVLLNSLTRGGVVDVEWYRLLQDGIRDDGKELFLREKLETTPGFIDRFGALCRNGGVKR